MSDTADSREIAPLRNFGITGTRHGMTNAQKASLEDLLDESNICLHHGCCVGADEDAHWLGVSLGLRLVGHPPVDDRLMMQVNDGSGFSEVFPPKPYHIRNRDIVEQCSLLIAFPYEEEEQPSGGTWYTVRYARKIGREHVIIWPDGSRDRVAGVA